MAEAPDGIEDYMLDCHSAIDDTFKAQYGEEAAKLLEQL